MKSTASVFLAAFVAASAGWAGFVLAPQIQLGHLALAKPTGGESLYPVARPGLAAQGAEVYRSLGCVHCHSQQVRQEGAYCEVLITDLGTNRSALEAIIRKLKPETPATTEVQLGLVARAKDVPAADPLAAELKKGGAKVEVRVVPTGPDIARGWGKRQSIAQDYLYDYPVLMGTRRSGPDLSNVGAGKPLDWQLVHLYAPRAVVPNSSMPPYRFLFRTQPIAGRKSPDALNLPPAFAPPEGFEVVPTEAGRALGAYLASLRTDAPFFEAPFTLAQAVAESVTNSIAK